MKKILFRTLAFGLLSLSGLVTGLSGQTRLNTPIIWTNGSPMPDFTIPAGTQRIRVELRGGDGKPMNSIGDAGAGGQGHKLTVEFLPIPVIPSITASFIPGGTQGSAGVGNRPQTGNHGGVGAVIQYGATTMFAIAGGGGGGGSRTEAGGDGGALNVQAYDGDNPARQGGKGGGRYISTIAMTAYGGGGGIRTNNGGFAGGYGAVWRANPVIVPPSYDDDGNYSLGYTIPAGGGNGGYGGYSDSGNNQQIRGNGGGGGGGYGGGGGGGGGSEAGAGGGGGSGIGGIYASLTDNAAPSLEAYTDGAIAVTFLGGDTHVSPDRPTATIWADHTYILVGETTGIHATYAADTANGDSLTGTNIEQPLDTGLPGLTPTDPNDKNYSFTPTATGDYTFYARAQSVRFAWDTYNQVTVHVMDTIPPVTADIIANPSSGTAPLNTTITWTSEYANVVSVSGPGLSNSSLSGALNLNLAPGIHTFTITATGPTGSIVKSTTVTVTDPYCNLTTSVSPAGAGSVTGAGPYISGQTATVAATANAAYTFAGWNGDAVGSSNPLTILMSGDRNAIAMFTTKSPQSILFPNPGLREVGITFTLQATATSGLPVTYTVVSGSALLTPPNLLTPTAQGSITIRAIQAGDATWAPAAPVDVTFNAYPPAKVIFKEESSETGLENSKTRSTPNKVVNGP